MRMADCHPDRKHRRNGLCASCSAMNWRKTDKGKLRLTEQRLRRRDKMRKMLDALKDKPCMDCGIRYPPYVMDYDHRDPTTKEFKLGMMASKGIAAMLREIEKCDLVCSNCHRIRTHARLQELSTA